MSLDLYMIIKSCEHCGHTPERENVNITYNLAPMWYFIYPNDKNMIDIDGMLGKEAKEKLLVALTKLKKNPETFIPMEPSNGWGTYEDFLSCIEKLIEICKKYPDGVWQSCR